VSALPGQTRQQLALHVAYGLNPARVTGTIAVAGQAVHGTSRVTVKGRTLLEAPAGEALSLDAPVNAADLTDHPLVLSPQVLAWAEGAGLPSAGLPVLDPGRLRQIGEELDCQASALTFLSAYLDFLGPSGWPPSALPWS